MKTAKLDVRILIVIILLLPFWAIFVNYLFSIKFFTPISISTNHLINETWVANILGILLFSLPIFYIGKLKFESIGITKEKVRVALKYIVFIWAISQLISIVIALLSTNHLMLVQDFNVTIGRFLGQFFGNAAFEELIFRGVLYAQFYILLNKKGSVRFSILLSVILSQLIFVLMHFPNRLMLSQDKDILQDLITVFVLGILLTLLFARTENLVLLIGIHALINVSFNIFEPSFPVELIVLVIAIILGLFWNKLHPKRIEQLHP